MRPLLATPVKAVAGQVKTSGDVTATVPAIDGIHNDVQMGTTQDWISVGALGEAFAPRANVLPWAERLLGKNLRLFLPNDAVLDLQFLATGIATWRSRALLAGVPEENTVATDAIATEIRPGIFFVDFINPLQRASTISAVLDLASRACTVVLGQLPTDEETSQPMLQRIAEKKELTSVSAKFLHGWIDAPSEGTGHAETSELVGKRVEYTYSPTERYEHVYLNDKLYSWHCLEGSERGLADTDRCHAVRIAPLLYLFVWREKIVPTLGIVLLDLERLKTTGKILGYRTLDSGEITNFPVGALARVVSSI